MVAWTVANYGSIEPKSGLASMGDQEENLLIQEKIASTARRANCNVSHYAILDQKKQRIDTLMTSDYSLILKYHVDFRGIPDKRPNFPSKTN